MSELKWRPWFSFWPVPVGLGPDGEEMYRWGLMQRAVTGNWFRWTYYYRLSNKWQYPQDPNGPKGHGMIIGQENWV